VHHPFDVSTRAARTSSGPRAGHPGAPITAPRPARASPQRPSPRRAGGGALILLAGIITHIDVPIRETSLFNLLLILTLLVGGIGLTFRKPSAFLPARRLFEEE
jgi:hypothetical protein